MGQVLHGSARTTQAIRRAIQHSQKSLATCYSIKPNPVAKWRKRPTAQDARMGPEPVSTVLTTDQEAIALAFRRHTLWALDDCLYALQATIPHLSRSALHRCFQRHGISRLPLTENEKGVQRTPHRLPACRLRRSLHRRRPLVLLCDH